MKHLASDSPAVRDPYQGKHAASSAPARIAPTAVPVAFICTLVLIAAFVVFMAISPTYVSHVLGGRTLFADAVDLDVQEGITGHAQLAYDAANIEAVGKQDAGKSQACYGYTFAYADTITSGVVHTWKEYDLVGETEATFAGKGMYDTYDRYTFDDEQAALRQLYVAITEGKPVALHVQLASGGEHWVAIVGFQGVFDLGVLSLGNFLMLDAAGAEGATPEVLDCRGYTLKLDDEQTMYISKASTSVVRGEQIVLRRHGMKVSQSSGMMQWNRLFGETALGTMATISEEGFSVCETVVLASADGYWDALSASGLAGVLNCPVLLTEPNALSTQAADEIARLKATQVIIVGGTASVGEAVEKTLAENNAHTVKRLAGDTAIDTALEVYREGGMRWSDVAIVATTNSYHDALAIAPYAYAKRAPIFLALGEHGQLSAESYEALQGFSQVVISGGTASVAASVETQLEQQGNNPLRLAGNNAYETSVAVATWCLEEGMTADNMGVATGSGHWDALAAGAFCGKRGSVLVLAADENASAVESFIAPHATHIARAWVFGGSAAVSDNVFDALLAATA